MDALEGVAVTLGVRLGVGEMVEGGVFEVVDDFVRLITLVELCDMDFGELVGEAVMGVLEGVLERWVEVGVKEIVGVKLGDLLGVGVKDGVGVFETRPPALDERVSTLEVW